MVVSNSGLSARVKLRGQDLTLTPLTPSFKCIELARHTCQRPLQCVEIPVNVEFRNTTQTILSETVVSLNKVAHSLN